MGRRVGEIAGAFEFDEELVDAWHASSYVIQAFAQLGYDEAGRKEIVRRFINKSRHLENVTTRLRTAARLTHPGCMKVELAVTYLENNGERMRCLRTLGQTPSKRMSVMARSVWSDFRRRLQTPRVYCKHGRHGFTA